MKPPLVTLLTDFGLRDHYVGSVKAAVLSSCPEARLIDLTHLVPPQNLLVGASLLADAIPDFPSGTIHLAVVDPGVGTKRRPLVVETDEAILVGPDNGLLAPAIDDAAHFEAYDISSLLRPDAPTTFHGRDLFGVAAGRLASGEDPASLGPGVADPCSLELPWLSVAEDGARGLVVRIDHFGNIVTSIRPRDLPKGCRPVGVDPPSGKRIPFARTYQDVSKGKLVCLFGSAGRLEIALRDGHAASRLGLEPGQEVSLRW